MLRDHLLNLGEIFHSIVVEFGVEAGRCAVNAARVSRETGFDPGAEAAVENVDILGSEGAEHPPCSRSGKDAFLLVDHYRHVIVDTKSRHAMRKNIGRGQHVGQWAGAVGELVDIEEDRARNVLRDVACARINRRRDTDRRERGIKDHDAWIAQTVG